MDLERSDQGHLTFGAKENNNIMHAVYALDFGRMSIWIIGSLVSKQPRIV